MTSLASVNGPSVTRILPPESLTRTPSAVGRSPAVFTKAPDRVISSISLPMSAMSFALGFWPDRSLIRIIERNRIVWLLFIGAPGTSRWDGDWDLNARPRLYDERGGAKSTGPTNYLASGFSRNKTS